MDAATIPIIITIITPIGAALGSILTMLVKNTLDKKKKDEDQDKLISSISAIQKNSDENIREIRNKIDSVHIDNKTISAEVHKHGIELAKQSFYNERMPDFDRLLSGFAYVFDYEENSETLKRVIEFARNHPVERMAVIRLQEKIHPEKNYKFSYEQKLKGAGL